jgi:MFS family permease
MSFKTVFSHKAFTILWIGRLGHHIANLTQSVAIGWSVYTIARQSYDERYSMFLVGMIGLAQFLPQFLLVLTAGETADRYDKRQIYFWCATAQAGCAAAFTLLSLYDHDSVTPIFIVAFFFSVARAFLMPALIALIPALVPRDILPKAIAWNTLSVQGGIVLGAWLGGILCAIHPAAANASAAALYCLSSLAAVILLRLPIVAKPPQSGAARLDLIREGLAYMWRSKAVLGALSLDMVAILLGGVTALLPAYAKDILAIGPEGFGELRSATAFGGGIMTLALALNPIQRHVGKWMLGSLALYGAATLAFAYSRDVDLSLLTLAIAGAAASLSGFVRQNLVQILTPDAMRGRVSAVSGLFIMTAYELGEFESGVAARFLGVIGAAAFGGIGSIAVTGLWAKLFPALPKADRLVAPKE